MTTFHLWVSVACGVTTFAFAWHSRRAGAANNWFRLSLGLTGASSALAVPGLFDALSAATSMQLFAWASSVLGAVGGALAVTSIRPQDWRVPGLLPQWEPEPPRKP
ncbi:hypothetical protein [uncultured Pseudacidovorax sp.]|uniref:hypothetical protein n=1 Tax=uncultured Pseudacidovorax sp. TaxID=679313 RepID=UPI0025DCA363|nr:hypothetical protein [uncultured Pseudacidovorax sp.]